MEDVNFDDTYIIEGVVESDPMTNRCTIRTADAQGNLVVFDPQVALKQFAGREVRLVLVPMATVEQLQKLVQETGVDP